MTNALSIIRSLVIYGLCLPLAIFLGYLLAMPMDAVSFTIVIVVLFLPLLPFLLHQHHLLLFACWNMSAVLFFLPGSPNLWLVMTLVSFMLSILQRILNRNIRFLSVPSVTRPLILLALVIVITAQLTGGYGMKFMGGESMGGKRYFLLFAAIIGYFGMTCYRVPEGRVVTYVALYLLGGLTQVVGSVAPYFLSSFFYPIFAFFPIENVEALSRDASVEVSTLRLGGLTYGCMAIFFFLLARHGVRGLLGLGEELSFTPFRLRNGFGVNQPWRILLLLAVVWVALMGGYRSNAILLALTFLVQFSYEGLFRTRLLPMLVLAGVLGVAVSLPMIQKLPLTVQRSLSFLPVEVDPAARLGADSSTEWRLQMWREVLPTVPQYLLLGKGYGINLSDLQIVQMRPGASTGGAAEGAILAGDYHNGPLSVIIPLGIFGAIGFLWLLGAGLRVLLNNFRHGDPELRRVNTFLLSYFAARTIFFFFVFGSFYSELMVFTGLLGLSVSINGGMRGPAAVPAANTVFNQFKLARATR
jgi:hypothetical protein